MSPPPQTGHDSSLNDSSSINHMLWPSHSPDLSSYGRFWSGVLRQCATLPTSAPVEGRSFGMMMFVHSVQFQRCAKLMAALKLFLWLMVAEHLTNTLSVHPSFNLSIDKFFSQMEWRPRVVFFNDLFSNLGYDDLGMMVVTITVKCIMRHVSYQSHHKCRWFPSR